MKKLVALLVLLICFAGCSTNRARLGSYTFDTTGADAVGNAVPTKYAIELKANDEFVISKTGGLGLPTVSGKYTIEGDAITFNLTIQGTTGVGKAHFDGTAMVLDDNTLFSPEMRLTKQN